MMLSIVVPTYNEESRIERFLSSLRRQTSSDFEVIFVDGGSVDGTIQMIQEANFTPLKEVGKRAPGNARNQGIAAAIGDILVSLNVDTVLGDDYVEKIIDAFGQFPDADAITFNHDLIVPENMTTVGKALFLRDIGYGFDGKYTVMKTSYWRKLAPYDSEMGFGEDRAMRKSYKSIFCKTEVSNKTISVSEMSFQDLGGYAKRCLWYGRTIPAYLSKETDRPIALYYLMSILFIPFAFVMSLVSLLFMVIVLLYGCFRAVRILSKGYVWRQLCLLPLLELYGFICIGLGFYSWLFGNKNIGR